MGAEIKPLTPVVDPAQLAIRATVTILQTALGERAASHDFTNIEVAIRKTAADLAGPHPTPLERLLAERAAVCWGAAHLGDFAAAVGGRTLALHEHYANSRDRAHARFLSACKTLAHVRKLGVNIQINMAHKQVVANGEGALR